jgi:alpha-beta hydrolase superfamily lysophospholipase
MTLEACADALDDAKHGADRAFDRERTAVILGNSMGGEIGDEYTLRVMFPAIRKALEEVPNFAALPDAARVAILSAYEPADGLNVGLFRFFMVVAAIGTVLAAGYLLWLYQRTAFGTPKDEFAKDPHIHDVTKFEWMAWLPILILIVVLGVAPGLIFNVTNPAVSLIAGAVGG